MVSSATFTTFKRNTVKFRKAFFILIITFFKRVFVETNIYMSLLHSFFEFTT